MQERSRNKIVLYKYTVSAPTKPHQVYIGISEDEWKKQPFRKKHKNETLSRS